MSATRLQGKTALVTGASKGIGKAIALALGAQGANVIVNYLSSAAGANEVVAQIGSERAVAVQADVGDVAQAKTLVQASVDRFKKIDFLILNAGLLMQNGGLPQVTEESYERIMRANVKGPLFLTQEAVPHIPSGGRVLFFSSSLTAASTVFPNYLLYLLSKGAVEQMARVLAKDLFRNGVSVNVISPGPIGTDAYYVGKTEQLVKMIAGGYPAGRIGTPEEVASTVAMLVGEESSWVNGVNLRINGGMTVG